MASQPNLIQPDYQSKPVTTLRDVVIKAISFVNKGANGKRFFLFKSEDGVGNSDEYYEVSPLIKQYDPSSDEWNVAYCVIAEPNETDKQKDVWSEEEIRKAAHEFIPGGGLLNFMHETLDKVGELVENALAHDDLTIQTPNGPEVIKKGSWYIGVRPNDNVKKMIQNGEITGMSVQGSARREPVSKADKDDRPVPKGAEGEGVEMLQRILGVPETGKYDDATADALHEWMRDKGVPGVPTLATLKMALADRPEVAPQPEVEAPQAEEPAPTAVPQEAEKGDGYDPAERRETYGEDFNEVNDAKRGPAPGNEGVSANKVTVNSSSHDLKAVIARSMGEGNEELAEHLATNHNIGQVESLYRAEISQPELWYMVSKYILTNETVNIDAEGNLSTGPQATKAAVDPVNTPEVQKESREDEPKFSEGLVEGAVVEHEGFAFQIAEISGDEVVLERVTQANKVVKKRVPKSDLEVIAGKVEKSRLGGSMGGHHPAKHGKIRFIVRSFGRWAGGKQSIAARRLYLEHPEVVNGSWRGANALAAWLKDQWMGTTKWRKGNQRLGKMVDEAVTSLVKSWEEQLRSLDTKEALDAADNLAKGANLFGQASDESVDALFKAAVYSTGLEVQNVERYLDSDDFDEWVTKSLIETHPGARSAPVEKDKDADKDMDPNDAIIAKVVETLRNGGDDVEKTLAKVGEVLRNGVEEEKPKGLDAAMAALKGSLTKAVEAEDREQRVAHVENILHDFTNYLARVKKNSESPSPDSQRHDDSEGNENRTFLTKGEGMNRKRIEVDVEALEGAAAAITSALDGGATAEAPAEAPAEVEKEEDKKDKEAMPEGEAPEAPAADSADDLDSEPEADAADEDEEITEDELLEVVNHLVEEVEELTRRLGALEKLDSKLDKVGELAKALDTTDDLEVLSATVSELSKKLEDSAPAEAVESLSKRLDTIESTPSAPKSRPVDEHLRSKDEALSKSAPKADDPNDPATMWRGTF